MWPHEIISHLCITCLFSVHRNIYGFRKKTKITQNVPKTRTIPRSNAVRPAKYETQRKKNIKNEQNKTYQITKPVLYWLWLQQEKQTFKCIPNVIDKTKNARTEIRGATDILQALVICANSCGRRFSNTLALENGTRMKKKKITGSLNLATKYLSVPTGDYSKRKYDDKIEQTRNEGVGCRTIFFDVPQPNRKWSKRIGNHSLSLQIIFPPSSRRAHCFSLLVIYT